MLAFFAPRRSRRQTRQRRGDRFGEEGGLLTYGSYLRLPELLAQQVPQVDPPAMTKLLFITVHQAYELWFQQLLHELAAARGAMTAGQTWRARQLLRRVHVIERLLVSQIDVLETMTPQDFLEFRAALAPASGFQSVQFRELSSCPGEGRRVHRPVPDRPTGPWLALAEPSLWDAYLGLLRSRGLQVAAADEILASLVTIARDRASHDDLWELAEDLLTHDEIAGLWRARHVQMVERQIGTKSGRRVTARRMTTGSAAYYPRVELRDFVTARRGPRDRWRRTRATEAPRAGRRPRTSATVALRYLRAYYRHVAVEDLAEAGPARIAAVATEQAAFAAHRPQGRALVRVSGSARPARSTRPAG